MDPVFDSTAITNEAGALDYPWYWTSTTHLNYSPSPGRYAVYICFGRALGYFNGVWQDVHGAGSQRSDPKSGSLSDWTYVCDGYYSAQAPQGDAIRLYNFVRAVRGGADPPPMDTDGDGIPDWTEYSYTTNTTTLGANEDEDNDGMTNREELAAGTSLLNPNSLFVMESIDRAESATAITWSSVLGKRYRIEVCTNLMSQSFATLALDIPAEPPQNQYSWENESSDASTGYYRIVLE